MSTGWVRSEMDEVQLRQAVMPMIDSYLRIMRGAARAELAEREKVQDACEAEFRLRLDAFAGRHGFFGEDRVFLNGLVASTFDERADATKPASKEGAAANVVSRGGPHWWAQVLAAVVGVLLVMR